MRHKSGEITYYSTSYNYTHSLLTSPFYH
jgi:hypothetical protein